MLFALVPVTDLSEPYPILSVLGPELPRGTITTGGYPLEDKLSSVFVQARDGDEGPPGLADFMESVNFRFVSRKLKEVLETLKVSAEFIPTVVTYKGKEIRDEYFVFNPLKRVDGIDRAKSQLEIDEFGLASEIGSLVLDPKRFEGMPVSVLDATQQIIVQAHAAEIITASRCIGCNFVDPQTDAIGRA